uniref:deoxyhypusine synthase n=1 Tax=Globodera pallida TaxID=36090 RepID=A0A183BV19_GLOPA
MEVSNSSNASSAQIFDDDSVLDITGIGHNDGTEREVEEIAMALMAGGPLPTERAHVVVHQQQNQQPNGSTSAVSSMPGPNHPCFWSQLGGKKLECGGHLYRRSRHRGDSFYWRCDQNRRYGCVGSARTLGMDEGIEVELGKPHNHEPCPARCAALRLTRRIRRTALAAGGCLPPRAVIEECLAGASPDVRAALPHVESLKRAVYRKRRNADGTQPQSGASADYVDFPEAQKAESNSHEVQAVITVKGEEIEIPMHDSHENPVVPSSSELALSRQAVLVSSDQQQQQLQDHEQLPVVVGYDFNAGIHWEALLDSFMTTGFQASHMGIAIQEINSMIEERSAPVHFEPGVDPFFDYPQNNGRRRRGLTIFLGLFGYLVEHDQVDCVVTSAGGIEEDLIKCLRPTYLGNFKMSGTELRAGGINRAGNLLIPNSNYCAFEGWLNPILDECLEEQRHQGTRWTPSKLIARLGSEIGDKRSICYWAWCHRIPIFCPALTDGSLGDMLYFHSVKNGGDGIVLDIVEDLRYLNTMAILGGGVVKHHINNANLMRNGSDRTVYINSGQEFDGSDSGAEPDEAVSWGKVKGTARAVKVCADATLVFPLIVARTFARAVAQRRHRRGGGSGGGQQHQTPCSSSSL